MASASAAPTKRDREEEQHLNPAGDEAAAAGEAAASGPASGAAGDQVSAEGEAPPTKKTKEDTQKDTKAAPESSIELWRQAQYWYYRDRSEQLQGPFYPADMREWFHAGHFDAAQLVAPSYRGEVPQEFETIAKLFVPLSTAFVSDAAVPDRGPQ